MIVSMPNMGNSWPAFRAVCRAGGVEVVLPDPTNRAAVAVGVAQSPEWVCFPFKTTLGDFASAIAKGADTLVMAIDCGPCRFGFYHALQERLLHDMGHRHVRIVPIDQADLLTFRWFHAFSNLGGRRGPRAWCHTVRGTVHFMKKAKAIEDIERLEGIVRAYEIHPGDTTRAVQDLIRCVDEADDLRAMRGLRRTIADTFLRIPVDPARQTLQVALAGELHVTLEPYINQDVRRRLGELGCEVHQSLSLFDWVVHKFHLNFHRKWLERQARPYLSMDIGGEAVWVVGEYIDRAGKGCDGFVHTYPFTCMPEVAARTIIANELQPRLGLPVLFLSLDEHAGAEGLRTRLESFVELMKNRRQARPSTAPAVQDLPTRIRSALQLEGTRS